MNAMVCEIPHVLRAERPKMKGTLAFWLALIGADGDRLPAGFVRLYEP